MSSSISPLGCRLFARQSKHTDDWRHLGTVESVHEIAGDFNDGSFVMVAMRDGGRAYLADLGMKIEEPPGAAVCVSLHLIDISPLLKLEPTNHFCLDVPMGPGVDDLHVRVTQRIDL